MLAALVALQTRHRLWQMHAVGAKHAHHVKSRSFYTLLIVDFRHDE